MISEQQYISKGIYQYSQIGNFISVKNYIFLRRNEKKCLLIRFSNDLNYAVNSMSYILVQMDAAGKTLAKTRMKHEALDFQPGSEYITTQFITVDEYCTDFKVVFSEVTSGKYRYRVRDKMVAVYYDKETEPIVDIPSSRRKRRKLMDEELDRYRVKQKKFLEPGVAAFVAAIAIVLVLALNIVNVFFNYIEARTGREWWDFFGLDELIEDLLQTDAMGMETDFFEFPQDTEFEDRTEI